MVRGSAAQILHILPDISAAAARRTAQIIAGVRQGYEHSILAARPNDRDWLTGVRQDSVRFISDFPELSGLPLPGRLQRIAQAMLPFDVVVTHGYDAMNAAMARTMFSEGYAPPPLIHHEWGDDAAGGALKGRRRDLYRQLALGRSAALVVPDETLEARALTRWQQPLGRVKRIGEAVDVTAYARRPKADSLPGIIKRKDELWIGVVDGAGNGGGIDAALEAVRALPENCILIWASAGDHPRTVREAAARAGMDDRVHPLASGGQHARYLGLFDVALVPASGIWPQEAVLGAAAAGVPFAGEGAAALAEFLAPENAALFQEPAGQALRDLISRSDLRQQLGEANRRRAAAEFGLDRLAATYRRLFDSAIAQAPRKR